MRYEGIGRVLQGVGFVYQQNMIGIATDGASVMMGVQRGVTTTGRFKSVQPYIVATHYMAHRLQLACQKAAKKVPYLQKYKSRLAIIRLIITRIGYNAVSRGPEFLPPGGKWALQVTITL